MYKFVFRWADRPVWWPHRPFPSSWSQRRRLPQWTSGRGLLFWTQVRVGQRSDSFLMSKWTFIYYLTCFPDDLPKKKPPQLYKPSNPDTLAYLDFSVSTTGMLAGVKVSINHPLLCEIRNPCSLFPQHKKTGRKRLKTHLTDIKPSQLAAGEIRCHMHRGTFLLYCLEMKTRFWTGSCYYVIGAMSVCGDHPVLCSSSVLLTKNWSVQSRRSPVQPYTLIYLLAFPHGSPQNTSLVLIVSLWIK